jgi:hypothetical protein
MALRGVARSRGLEAPTDELDCFGQHARAETEGARDHGRLAKDVAREIEDRRLTLSERA